VWIAVVDKVGEYDRQTQTDRMVKNGDCVARLSSLISHSVLGRLCICACPSVCLSVRLTRAGIVNIT